ncbi:MAG: DNA glycosylase, partial [Candidatus Woodwardiibium sp.]
MVVSFTPAGTVLTGAALDIRKTFDCGQCFRFAPDGGGYTGVAFGRVLHVTQDGGSIMLHGVDRAAYEAVWADYFDLARDYEALSDAFCGDEALRTAYAFSRGIRILAQDPWETLCSFILSQNNNIPRIRKIIA